MLNHLLYRWLLEMPHGLLTFKPTGDSHQACREMDGWLRGHQSSLQDALRMLSGCSRMLTGSNRSRQQRMKPSIGIGKLAGLLPHLREYMMQSFDSRQ